MSVSLENKPNLPAEFIALATESLGKASVDTLLRRLESSRSLTAVRLNRAKLLERESGGTSGQELIRELFKDQAAGNVPWSEIGFYLKERPQFTLDPLFHAGAYYVQEASSMYLDLIKTAIEAACARTEESGFFEDSLLALDLCAAPGGKTTHLASLLNNHSLLVANEVIKSRAAILADNVAKWGCSRVMVTNNDPKDFEELPQVFDLVVADAPCSGEGLFGKDPEAVREWSPAHVKLCSERQRRILADIWPAVKPGGFLVYSTCTYNHFENDDVVRYLKQEFGAQSVPIEIPPDSGIQPTPEGGLQFIPGRVEGEGQFVALLRKPGDRADAMPCWKKHPGGKRREGSGKSARSERSGKKEKGGNTPACPFMPQGYEPFVQGEFVLGISSAVLEQTLYLKEILRSLLSGVAVASVKGRDFIPHADLALLAGTPLDTFPNVAITREEALKFLAKEPLVFPGAPLGYLLLTYQGVGLGFVKNLGTRSNNLLPMARRIRMEIK